MMKDSTFTLSVDELSGFHSIDRSLYSFLVNELLHDPVQSLQIMALWIWMERTGINNIIKKILSFPQMLIDKLADEAVTYLSFINDTKLILLPERSEIPLTKRFVKEEISLHFFHQNQVKAKDGINKVVKDVCLTAFNDIMELALKRNASSASVANKLVRLPIINQFFINNNADLGFVVESSDESSRRTLVNEIPRENRTMFVTFSKGYPVSEQELREFFSTTFGECIESFNMQAVRPGEQSLYACVVFHSPLLIDNILNGSVHVKFNINGKDMRMRKFVPKRASRSAPQLLPSTLRDAI